MLPFARWLPQQRWYAGRRRTIDAVELAVVTPIRENLDHVLIDVAYADGEPEQYQVLVGWRPSAELTCPPHAVIGMSDVRAGFDALYDPQVRQELLDLIAGDADVGDLRFRREPDRRLPVDVPNRLVEVEHRDTLLVYGDQAVLRFLRRTMPGLRPDEVLHRALSRAGSGHVPAFLGAVDHTPAGGAPRSMAILTRYAGNAADGWDLVSASIRDLFVGSGPPDEAGGDFAGEAYRLGSAVAGVHRTLAEVFGTGRALFPAVPMIERLKAAVGVVPELAERAGEIEGAIRAADRPGGIEVQRVHRTLNLGQVLRTPGGWLLTNFDGQPDQPWQERNEPDSPMLDVAGMWYSFELAPYRLGIPQSDRSLTTAWVERNWGSFREGYGRDRTADFVTLRAYALDLAVSEMARLAHATPPLLATVSSILDRILHSSS